MNLWKIRTKDKTKIGNQSYSSKRATEKAIKEIESFIEIFGGNIIGDLEPYRVEN